MLTELIKVSTLGDEGIMARRTVVFDVGLAWHRAVGSQPDPITPMTVVTLRPEVIFSDENLPTREQIEHMHHRAHEECFIANSVKTDVRCEQVFRP
ncbi:OsmC family protein [[Pseudomonas] boreopolis]|uniref:OsmC family protein n=1 Tax=Xanthomonas boreopolis TaxID=86183 RepID=UPI003DA02127